MARSDLSNVSSDLSSSENLLDSTDDASFPDTDEVKNVIMLVNKKTKILMFLVLVEVSAPMTI